MVARQPFKRGSGRKFSLHPTVRVISIRLLSFAKSPPTWDCRSAVALILLYWCPDATGHPQALFNGASFEGNNPDMADLTHTLAFAFRQPKHALTG
jgi:hypothetical protein